MHSNLSDHQLKIDYYMHRLLYMNFMVTTNQKHITDTQKIKRKKYKHNTKESHQITVEENKRRIKEQIRTTKTTRKQ